MAQPERAADGPERLLLHAIDQLALEGGADLVDKPALLAKGGAYAERFQAAFATSAATIETTDALLKAIAADSTRMKDNAAAIWKGLPFAGHTTGFYMAQTIRDALGRGALDECVRNPFTLFPTYNAAARALNAQGQARPFFSDASLAVIAALAPQADRHHVQ